MDRGKDYNPEEETLTEYLSRIWGGSRWRCGITGEGCTLPLVVHRGDFYSFGKSYIDVGDEFYARFGGKPIEVKEEK